MEWSVADAAQARWKTSREKETPGSATLTVNRKPRTGPAPSFTWTPSRTVWAVTSGGHFVHHDETAAASARVSGTRHPSSGWSPHQPRSRGRDVRDVREDVCNGGRALTMQSLTHRQAARTQTYRPPSSGDPMPMSSRATIPPRPPSLSAHTTHQPSTTTTEPEAQGTLK